MGWPQAALLLVRHHASQSCYALHESVCAMGRHMWLMHKRPIMPWTWHHLAPCQVRITALVGNTYHARVHYGRARSAPSALSGDGAAGGGLPAEIDVDARPSGAG